MAIASASVRLKRLRQRFGIRAPKVAIRTHVAWYWRALATIAIASISLALAAWIIDAGRGIADFPSGASAKEIQALQLRIVELETELSKVRAVADSSESSLRMENATQQQLARQVNALESENANLKQDLAFFESMGVASAIEEDSGVNISRLRIEAETTSGQYRYKMLLVHKGGRQAKEFKGVLQLLVKVRQGGKDAMITLPSESGTNLAQYRFVIRHFQRAEGVFVVPAGAVVQGVEARLLQDGVVRARQSVTL
jgi:hypothetical protein